ncbi:glycoside hydrolase family 27 protein [Nibricoccus sp. IMCC34717]|uniref:glycoside hydrolase family 27 protein n=1 Tax=Nibricoccus sp. IMCC34717 TaxID=3034021 RepID=UPI00384C08C5
MHPLKSCLLALTAGLVAVSASAQKFEGLALTPPMGWNTWNTFESHISEQLLKETAETMIANGMRDAGYRYIVIDDCWSQRERDANGNLVADPVKFPSGMKALADYLHERGFKFGIYNCAGLRTCAGFPGGWGHEFQDARTYASWGVDYLKYDWCENNGANAKDAYARMSAALKAAGRPIVFSLCEWGANKPWEWAEPIGHLWRTTGDIYDSYDGRLSYSSGWKVILDKQATLVDAIGPDGLAKFAGPGHWNDPDMLEVGNPGLTLAESRSHFSFWCILAAPLMAGNDIRHATPDIVSILTDKDAIAVNQDKAGKAGWRALVDPSRNVEIWVRPLSEGEWAVCVLNTASTDAEITIDWQRLHWIQGKFSVRDLWGKKAAGDTAKPLTVKLASHDVLFARLTPMAK